MEITIWNNTPLQSEQKWYIFKRPVGDCHSTYLPAILWSCNAPTAPTVHAMMAKFGKNRKIPTTKNKMPKWQKVMQNTMKRADACMNYYDGPLVDITFHIWNNQTLIRNFLCVFTLFYLSLNSLTLKVWL